MSKKRAVIGGSSFLYISSTKRNVIKIVLKPIDRKGFP